MMPRAWAEDEQGSVFLKQYNEANAKLTKCLDDNKDAPTKCEDIRKEVARLEGEIAKLKKTKDGENPNYAKDKNGDLPKCPASTTIDSKDEHGYQCQKAQLLVEHGNTVVQAGQMVGSKVVEVQGQAAVNRLQNDTQGMPKQSEFYSAAADNLKSASKVEMVTGAATGAMAAIELAESFKRSRNAKEIAASINQSTLKDKLDANGAVIGADAMQGGGSAPPPPASGDKTKGAPNSSDLAKNQNLKVTQSAVTNMNGQNKDAVIKMGEKAAEEQRNLSKKLAMQGILHMVTAGAQIARGLMDKASAEQMSQAADGVADLEKTNIEIPTSTIDPVATPAPIALPGINPGSDNNPNPGSNSPFGPGVPSEGEKNEIVDSGAGNNGGPALGGTSGVGGGGAAGPAAVAVKDEYVDPQGGAGAGGGGFGAGAISSAAAKRDQENTEQERALNSAQGSYTSTGGGRRGGGGGDGFGSEISDAFKALLAQQQKEPDGEQKSILDYGRKPASQEESLLSADVNIFERISATYREKQIRGAI